MNGDTPIPSAALDIVQELAQSVCVPGDRGRLKVPLQSRLDDGLVLLPHVPVARDDVVAQEFGKNAVWNFFVVPALLVEVLILEHLGEVRRPVHQDVPLRTEKVFHGTMCPERLFNILAKQV